MTGKLDFAKKKKNTKKETTRPPPELPLIPR